MSEEGQGRVLIVDNQGSLKCAMFGDAITMKAAKKGAAAGEGAGQGPQRRRHGLLPALPEARLGVDGRPPAMGCHACRGPAARSHAAARGRRRRGSRGAPALLCHRLGGDCGQRLHPRRRHDGHVSQALSAAGGPATGAGPRWPTQHHARAACMPRLLRSPPPHGAGPCRFDIGIKAIATNPMKPGAPGGT